MRVVVVGATGNDGSSLVRRLSRDAEASVDGSRRVFRGGGARGRRGDRVRVVGRRLRARAEGPPRRRVVAGSGISASLSSRHKVVVEQIVDARERPRAHQEVLTGVGQRAAKLTAEGASTVPFATWRRSTSTV